MRNRSGHKRIERHFQKSQSGIHKEPKTSFPQPKRGKEKIIPCEIEGTSLSLARRRLTGCGSPEPAGNLTIRYLAEVQGAVALSCLHSIAHKREKSLWDDLACG